MSASSSSQHEHNHDETTTHGSGCGCCGPRPDEAERAAEVRAVKERWLENALREAEEADLAEGIEEAEALGKASGNTSIDELPAAEDLMEVVVSNVSEWATLMHLRMCAKWLSEIATRHMKTVGLRCGPRTHDFDQAGVLFLLGSAFHTNTWSLSEVMQRVRVYTSEIQVNLSRAAEPGRGYGVHLHSNESAPPLGSHPFFRRTRALDTARHFNNDISYLLDRSPRRVFISKMNCVGAWFALDLGKYLTVEVEEITLRHSSEQERALRSFRLDGSNAENPAHDERDWTPLLDVKDDTKLGVDADSTASWRVPPLEDNGASGSSGAPPKGFRFFRLVKTGPDHMGREYFHLSGIELYGVVRLQMDDSMARLHHNEDDEEEQESGPLAFKLELDVPTDVA